MGRLPFDPKKMAAAKKGGGRKSADDRPLSVSIVSAMIDQALKDGLPSRVSVIGEITGFRDRTHWYFGMKDEQSVLSCVMFASAARKAGFTPEDGQEVIARGRVEYYAKQGRTQLYVESMQPVGAGALELQFRKLCAELREAGYFEIEHKRVLPGFPRRVAVITSRTGAALQDVLDTMKRRCPAVEPALTDVRVQGDGAAREIARALRWVSREHERMGLDAVILTRGGGSMEDLWAFNERIVADAVFECDVPIVAAIGHETDTTIAELVADERAATPTQAAMRLVPDQLALLEQVDRLHHRLAMNVQRSMREERERLRGLGRHPLLASPLELVERARAEMRGVLGELRHAVRHQLGENARRLDRLTARLAAHRPEAVRARREAKVDELSRRLARSWSIMLERRGLQLNGLGRELEAVGPARVLARGYSVTTDEKGRLVRRTSDAKEGMPLLTRVTDGMIRSRVEGEAFGPAKKPVRKKVIRKKRKKRRRRDDSGGLFE